MEVRHFHSILKWTLVFLSLVLLSACGGGSGGDSSANSDKIAPVITLNGSSSVTIHLFDAYFEDGATASDNVDGMVNVDISGGVSVGLPGVYTITYTATDAAGNVATVTRTVTVVDPLPPVINLIGDSEISLAYGAEYVELGATASDSQGRALQVVIRGAVDSQKLGEQVLTYATSNSTGGVAEVTRTITVYDDINPEISLNGPAAIELFTYDDYQELGVVATDNADPNVAIEVTGNFDIGTAGDYVLTYTATDSSGNNATTQRNIKVKARRPFITTWKTDNPGASNNNQVMINVSSEHFTYSIEWGDGQTDEDVKGRIIHSYANAGTYTITIHAAQDFGLLMAGFNSGAYITDNDKLLSVEQWGDVRWHTMKEAFRFATNLVINTLESPNLTQATSLSETFRRASSLNDSLAQSLNRWDVSNITDMSGLFYDAENFNLDLSDWDVSEVENMSRMFDGAEQFNQDIGRWNVANVDLMYAMFADARAFNQDISAWDVSRVSNMSAMFRGAWAFNQDVTGWDISRVNDMSSMFSNAKSFNRNIGKWDVSRVENFSSILSYATDFDQDITSWDVSSATSMAYMFFGLTDFNQDISKWNVAKVRDFSGMFWAASSFNQDISGWDVSSATQMYAMFLRAGSFNRDIGQWDVSNVTSMRHMFWDASEFDQNLAAWDVSKVKDMSNMFLDVQLSTANYDALLSGWSALSLQSNVEFSGGKSRYSRANANAREQIIEQFNWTITDGGPISL